MNSISSSPHEKLDDDQISSVGDLEFSLDTPSVQDKQIQDLTPSSVWNKENDHDTEWFSKESHTRNDDDHTIDSCDTHMDHIAFNTHYSTYNDISTSSTSTHKGYTS